METIKKNREIKPNELSETPEFYQSRTNSATKDIISGNRDVYSGLYRLREVLEETLSLDAATVDWMSPTGIAPSNKTFSFVHKGNPSHPPYIFSFISLFIDSVVVSEPLIGSSKFTVTCTNYNLAPVNVKTKYYVYDLLIR